MTLRRSLVALCLCCLPACSGRVLDLDQEGSTAPSATGSDPGLPSSSYGLRGIWVDDQRLYWGDGGMLKGCLKADCKHTTLSYSTADHLFMTAAVANGQVYWTSIDPIIRSCPAEGCAAAPTTVVEDEWVSSQRIAANRQYVYWFSASDIYRCPAAGCAAIPEVFALDAQGDSMVFDETHAYWMDRSNGSGISSAPLDGSEPHKVLIPEAEPTALAVGQGYLYWAARRQMFRCAIASCDASPPTLLATADSDVGALEVDDTTLYWLAANTLQACPLSGCEQPQQLTPPRVFEFSPGSEEAQTFWIDANAVYWIEAPDPRGYGTAIRKTAKPQW